MGVEWLLYVKSRCNGCLFCNSYKLATITSLVIATKFIVTTLLNAFVSAGTFIWGCLGVTSVVFRHLPYSALSQKKGLEFTMTFTKIWIIPVSTGIDIIKIR
ncbi:MAG: hypothetical protein LBF68_06825 [Christensenellaceae bacterium]|jgi:hypothetical protein|nr:hypothetical protein [Christensenellaceae bacterium]